MYIDYTVMLFHVFSFKCRPTVLSLLLCGLVVSLYHPQILTSTVRQELASSPGPKRGPGTHCLRMRQSVPRFLVHRISVRISLRNARIGCSRNRRLHIIVLIAKFMVGGPSMIIAKPRGR